MAKFEPAVQIVLKNEGGYHNDPKDPGGETKYGISKKQYPNLDIKKLTVQDAKNIYYNDYWKGRGVEGLSDQKIANFALDTVVQHGKGPSLLQKAVNKSGGKVTVDNVLGPATRAAINALPPKVFLQNARQERLDYIENLVANGELPGEWLGALKSRVNDFFLSPLLNPLVGGLIALSVYLVWTRRKKLF